WQTSSAPWHQKAALGQGRSLLSRSGYGASEMFLHGRDGEVLDRWATSGAAVLTARDNLVVVGERASRDVSLLMPTGAVRAGPGLPGFYSSKPAADSDGGVLFACEGQLYRVNEHLRLEPLGSVPGSGDVRILSRTFIHED